MTTRDGAVVRVRRNNASLIVTLPRDRGWLEGELAQWDGDRLVRIRVITKGVRA